MSDLVNEWRKRRLFLFRGNAAGDEIRTKTDLSAAEYALLDPAFTAAHPHPALIDLDRLRALAASGGDRRENMLAARVRFQGTDGVRGRTNLAGDRCLERFRRNGTISPEFLYAYGLAFARMVIEDGDVPHDAEIVFGEDGRDFYGARRHGRALRLGLLDGGLTLVDLDVAATPETVYQTVRLGLRLGVAFTASHNPADQNGVKFFYNGRKLFPEGAVGEYALSARLFAAAQQVKGVALGRPCPARRLSAEGRRGFARDTAAWLGEPTRRLLSGRRVYVDPAAGAFCAAAKLAAAECRLDAVFVNNEPTGKNINRGGGAAEMEGRDLFTRDELPTGLALVDRMFADADKGADPLYGIVLDGDGDRGFLLIYAPGEDVLRVVDGDRAAFLCLEYLQRCGAYGGHSRPMVAVGTVESDLALFSALRRAGFEPRVSCVGDKWVWRHFQAGETLAVGAEISGHIAFPQTVAGRLLLTGNGFFTGLLTLAAVLDSGRPPAAAAEPYERGCACTRYLYNVDKLRFRPGTAVHDFARAAAVELLERLKKEAFGTKGRVEVLSFPDEPGMVYVAVRESDDPTSPPLAALFVRNSGTENKTAVYARGPRQHEPLLSAAAAELASRLAPKLKDPQSLDVRRERLILKLVGEGLPPDERMRQRLEQELGPLSPVTFRSLLYGLRKEGMLQA